MHTKIDRFKAFSGHAFLMLPMLSLQQVNCLSFRFYCKGATIQFWSSKITSVSKGVGICAHPLYFWQFYACLTSEVQLWWSKVNYFISRLSFVCIYISKNGRKFQLLCCMGSNVHGWKLGSLSFVCTAQHVSTRMVNVCSYQHKDFILTCLFTFKLLVGV